MASTTYELMAVQRYGDPEVGTLLARLNPETSIPMLGTDVRLPSRAELLALDRRLGGAALPPDDPAVAEVFRDYWQARLDSGL